MNIAVSACLMGKPCRYDGACVPNEAIEEMSEIHTLIPICPEQLGGLPTPRVPSEVSMDGRVRDRQGKDNTTAFITGAVKAMQIVRENKCKCVILKENSPSCGVHKIYDGTFSGRLVDGRGVAATYLVNQGIPVFSENELDRVPS